jgi:hypothetical protein
MDLVYAPRPRTRLDQILDYGKGLLETGAQIGKDIKRGYRTGEALLADPTTATGRTMFSPKFYQQLGEGAPARSVTDYVKNPETDKYIPKTTVELAREPISPTENPAAFAGAYTARVITDVGNNETLNWFWRARHPNAMQDDAVQRSLGKRDTPLTPTQQAVIRMATFSPIAASTGVISLANLGQLGRPAGFAQNYPDTETGDKKETSQPGQEIFDRFFLQHQGRPLPYAQAKQELPNLTPQQYGSYQNYLYQDKGLLGLGLIKGTMSNLQGVPEVRIANFPVTIPAVTAGIGGNIGLRQGIKAGLNPTRLAAAGFGGAVAGAAIGNVVNEMIARANRPTLPTVQQYQTQPGSTPLDLSQQGVG